MATLEQINKRAIQIFDETYSIEDIVKGNTLDMQRECFEKAREQLQKEEAEQYNHIDDMEVWEAEKLSKLDYEV